AAGHLASISSSNTGGASVSYTYDSLNRLHTAVDSHLGTTTYSYDDASNLASAAYSNGVQYGFNYDQLNRLKQIATQQTGYSYQLGPTGNKTSGLELNNRQATWTYDGIYRLTGETISNAPSGKNGSLSYTLDPVGNRLSDSSTLSGVSPVSGTYSADDELSAETYDPNGNVTATGGKSFTYDAENHLVSMGGTVTLVYDGDGNRVSKTVNGVTTKYLVDDLNPTGYPQIMDELTNGAVTRTYTDGLQRIGQYQVVSNTWTPSFYGYDGFGTVRNLTNSVGAITDTYEYDAFGNHWTVSGTTPNEMLYRGEQFDSDLGLYYLRARYYNPLTGRFLSRDPDDHELIGPDGYPADPKSLRKYLYAGGDPINAKDPTGRGEIFDYFFARGTGALNTNAYVRLGLGWNNVIKCLVFRLAIGSAGALIHWHYDFWDYCP
ncbi:MAG TPA: RHS repeat-associated core domain-containing protein, partial [Terracidiphilus sp.]|nr:RHS repeat-associated core domain-containing protein [Terracidiphilus sp.]